MPSARPARALALALSLALAWAPALPAAPIISSQLGGGGGVRGVPPAVAAGLAEIVRVSLAPDAPGLSSMRDLLPALAALDLSRPETRRDLGPVFAQLRAAAERLAPAELSSEALAPAQGEPDSGAVLDAGAAAEREAVAAEQLALLDHPILRELLSEEQRPRVSAAAAARRERLSQPRRERLDAAMRGIAERLRLPGDGAAGEPAGPEAVDASRLFGGRRLQAFLIRHGEEPRAFELTGLPSDPVPAPELARILNKDGRVRMVFSPDNPHGGLSAEDAPGLGGLLGRAGVGVPVEQEKVPVDWAHYEPGGEPGESEAAAAPSPQMEAAPRAEDSRRALRFTALLGGLALGWTMLGAWLPGSSPALIAGLALAHGILAGAGQARAGGAWRPGPMLRSALAAGLFALAWLALGAALGPAHPFVAGVLFAAPRILALGVGLLILWELPFIARTLRASMTAPKRDEVVIGVGTKLPPVVIGVIAWFTSIGLAHPILLFMALTLFLAMEAFHGVWVNSWENFQNNIFRLRQGNYQLVFNWLYIQLSGAIFRTLSWWANPEGVAPPWSGEYWKDMLIISIVGTFFGTLAYRGLNALYNNGRIGRKQRARIQQVRDFIMFSAGPLFSVGAMGWFWLIFSIQQSLDFVIYLVGLLTRKRPILYVTDPVVAGTREFKTMYLERWTAKEEHPLKQALKGLLYGPILRPLIFLFQLSLKPFVRKRAE